ncbi:MAG: tryptophan synthase subunit alpha [Oleiphilaceae bacterium]|nr:tryptophan synthase subunit alpha [Oleiphilaceae bacterium]
MSRIEKVMSALNASGKKALIPYITGGDPRPEWSVDIMHALVEAGADIIELGIPFSDPMADGPVIQLACERALAHNTSLNQVLQMVSRFREKDTDTPVVLMGYLNPVERKGYETFAREAAAAGVDGVLTVDLPPEEAEVLVPLLKQEGLDAVFLIAPTTTDSRIKEICQHSSGYVYYVSVKGVTGSASLSTDEVAEKVAAIKEMAEIPVGVGFGIRDASSAAQVASVADGVIVGSVLVNIIAENHDNLDVIKEKLSALVADMRQALDAL